MNSYSPRNRLLLAVPTRHLKELMADLEFIPCQREQILLDADSSLDHIFFPESGVVSVVAVLCRRQHHRDGDDWLGRLHRSADRFRRQGVISEAAVQIPGGAAKMSRAAFDRAMKSMPSFRGLMFAYVQAFLEQVLGRM
jgi:hypothetical protein